jgi:primosomal protein N''
MYISIKERKMRPWIDTLFHNSSAHVDFINYIDDVDKELKERIYNKIREGNVPTESANYTAEALAAEIAAFRRIASVFKRETKEHQKQVEKEVQDAKFRY